MFVGSVAFIEHTSWVDLDILITFFVPNYKIIYRSNKSGSIPIYSLRKCKDIYTPSLFEVCKLRTLSIANIKLCPLNELEFYFDKIN